MARKKSKGRRTESGRLSRSKFALEERNPPADHVLARRERFRHFRGDGSIGLEMTCAGRLMLVGAFDGLEVPAESILDEIQKYTLGYWAYYVGLAPSIGSYEPRSRSSGSGAWADKAGESFEARDELLTNAGRAARQAVHEISIDRHWFPDEDVAWAARIINSRIDAKRMQLRKANRPIPEGLCVAGELACDSDWAMWDLLRHGALALAGAKMRRAA